MEHPHRYWWRGNAGGQEVKHEKRTKRVRSRSHQNRKSENLDCRGFRFFVKCSNFASWRQFDLKFSRAHRVSLRTQVLRNEMRYAEITKRTRTFHHLTRFIHLLKKNKKILARTPSRSKIATTQQITHYIISIHQT